MKRNFVMKRKNLGMTLIEMAVVMVLGALLVLGGMKIIPNIQFALDASELNAEVNEIRTAALGWKASRPNFTGVTMAKLCSSGRQLLTEATCGTDSQGTNANPFGGNYSIAEGANLSQFVVTITNLPAARINELADGIAPLSADRCSSSDSCATAAITGTSLAVTF